MGDRLILTTKLTKGRLARVWHAVIWTGLTRERHGAGLLQGLVKQVICSEMDDNIFTDYHGLPFLGRKETTKGMNIDIKH